MIPTTVREGGDGVPTVAGSRREQPDDVVACAGPLSPGGDR